jgi:mannose-6-phosphate isomerase-like protein (cupin superfamily)
MKIIEQYIHEGNGYNPFLIAPKWQVAQLNHAPEEELEAIDKLDVHHKTDEVFFLIEGKAVLIAAEIQEDKITYDLELMKPGITYNIPKGVWHNIAMYENSKVLIIENANTHLPLPDGDYSFHYLSKQEQLELQNQVNQSLTNKAIQ